MAKAALEALAWTLAKEERRNGIHVNVVAPGLVDTEMGRRLVKGAMGVDDIRTMDGRSPFGHVCTSRRGRRRGAVRGVGAGVVRDGPAHRRRRRPVLTSPAEIRWPGSLNTVTRAMEGRRSEPHRRRR